MLGFRGPLWLALGSRAAFGAPQPLLQTVVTNVPGPRAPLYILGRRMSIAIFSYLDTFSFGLTADYESAPDLNVLLEGIGRGLAEIGKDAIAI
jgi:diacylglycerol O-acyltransferase / wax synthase